MIKNTFCFIVMLLCVLPPAVAQKATENFRKVKEFSGIEEYIYEPNGLKVLLKKKGFFLFYFVAYLEQKQQFGF